MNRPATLAVIGAVHVGRMFVTAVVLMAAIETVNFAMMAWESRKDA